jgi:hypothetical protein
MLCSAAFLQGQGKDRRDSPVVTSHGHELSLRVRIGQKYKNIEYSIVSARLQTSIAKNAVIRGYGAPVSVEILRISQTSGPHVKVAVIPGPPDSPPPRRQFSTEFYKM